MNFVAYDSEETLARFRQITDVDAHVKANVDFRIAMSKGGYMSWCLLSYLYLRLDHRLDVRLSNRIERNAINIVDTLRLGQLGRPPHAFVVAVRADHRRRPWAHYHIVQNRAQLRADTSYLCHWPQPSLLQRNPMRKGVKTLAYVGQTYNGNLAWTLDAWKSLFADDHLDFLVPDIGNWHDLRELDVIVAVRSFDGAPHNNKPASKLINAWLAGVPFIGGADSAYSQIGIDGINYFRVHTPDELLAAVRRLRDDPALYQSFVENGARAARTFTVEAIRENWVQVINGPISERYDRWLRRPWYEWVRTTAVAEADIHLSRLRRNARKVLMTMGKY